MRGTMRFQTCQRVNPDGDARSARRFAVLFVLAAVAGCTVPAPETPDAGGDVCGGCAEGLTCAPDRRACVTAIPEGALCGQNPDGSSIEGHCLPGMSCGSDGSGAKRCSKDCTAADAAQVCGAGRACFPRPDTQDSRGFCGTRAAEGERCDSATLTFCSQSNRVLGCIAPSAGVTAGRCFRLCDPSQPQSADCAAGQECADPFEDDPSFGICVMPPTGTPPPCDYSALTFCGHHAVCIRPTTESWGFCHRRCGTPSDCDAAQSCVQPGTEPFCAVAAARCPPGADPAQCPACDATKDEFCGSADLCVSLETALVCKQDCTASGQCAAGTCTPIAGGALKVCL